MSKALPWEQQRRPISHPSPGCFEVRAWRGGPHLPARITRLMPGGHALRHGWGDVLVADVFGDPVEVESLWFYGRRIHPDDHEAVATEYLDAVGCESLYGNL